MPLKRVSLMVYARYLDARTECGLPSVVISADGKKFYKEREKYSMRILVVVDMQNDFIDGSLGSPQARAIVPNVARKISGFDGQICCTMDTHYKNYLSTQEGKNLPVEHCIVTTHGWRLDEEIKANLGDGATFFYKDSFGSKDLMEWIGARDPDETVEELVFVGLCTDICVISNAIMAKSLFPEIKITVDASCCAGVTPESHENALRAMQMCQINIENWGA